MESCNTHFMEEWQKDAVPEEHSEILERMVRTVVPYNHKRVPLIDKIIFFLWIDI